MLNTDPHHKTFSNYSTNHRSGSHTVPKGITTLLSVLSNFKDKEKIELTQAKTLASGK